MHLLFLDDTWCWHLVCGYPWPPTSSLSLTKLTQSYFSHMNVSSLWAASTWDGAYQQVKRTHTLEESSGSRLSILFLTTAQQKPCSSLEASTVCVFPLFGRNSIKSQAWAYLLDSTTRRKSCPGGSGCAPSTAQSVRAPCPLPCVVTLPFVSGIAWLLPYYSPFSHWGVALSSPQWQMSHPHHTPELLLAAIFS